MSSAVRTEWMRDCGECIGFAEEMAEAENSPAADELNAAWAFQDHLVASHLAQIPGYRDDCEDCEEWRVITSSETPDVPPWWTVQDIAKQDLQHRANHLVWGE